MSTLDTAILVGVEDTYGTAATLTRAYEVQSDSIARETEYLESVGFRPGIAAALHNRRRPIHMGASGSLDLDVLDRGMGLLLATIIGPTDGPQETDGGSGVYVTEFVADREAPPKSLTVQVQRGTIEDALPIPFTYVGGVCTSWRLQHEVGSFLRLEATYDFQAEKTDVAAGSPTYPADGVPFDWGQCVITLDGNAVDATSFELTAELGMKTDRRFLRGSTLKKRPARTSVPVYEGTIEVEPDTSLYDLYVSGEPVDMTVTWTGGQIGSTGSDYAVTITIPAVQLTGQTPTASLDDATVQSVPFRVLWNGEDAPLTVTVQNADTAL